MPSLDINMLRQVRGVGPSTVLNFVAAGYGSLEDLSDVTIEQLIAVPSVGEATAQAILEFLAQLEDAGDLVRSYRFDEKRKNIPPAGLAGQGRIAEQDKVRYSYDPHLPPVLRFDGTGRTDRLPELLETSTQRPLLAEEARLLAEALRTHQPWLEWSGKRETTGFSVDPVALHMHERISAEAVVELAMRLPLQRGLFAETELPFHEQVRFYQHDIDWTNRLILGDSLTVMTSLARREDLAGKVQMIYIDPPYGIKFASNFQPFVNNRNVEDRDQDLTREPEQVRAYRDTWTLGIHSYLAYLRDRLIAARELLKPEGSIFVQISDENVHRVRMLLDEVFGSENFVSLISYKTTQSAGASTLDTSTDYLLWYARSNSQIKYRPLFKKLTRGDKGATRYDFVENQITGECRRLSEEEQDDDSMTSADWRFYTDQGLTSRGKGSEMTMAPIRFEGMEYEPTVGHWRTTAEKIEKRLIPCGRVIKAGTTLRFKKYFDDFGHLELTNLWDDVGGGIQSRVDPKVYVVQTANSIIQRCLLMTTDVGDLVLDPTCGAGTSAYVAEQWGRRWITIDTSRVAIAIARQRLLTARFDFYELADPQTGLRGGLVYACAPHVILDTYAQCDALDPIFARWEPVLTDKLETLNIALQYVSPELRTRLKHKLARKEKSEGKRSITDADRRRWLLPAEKWEEWEVPFDTDDEWPSELKEALTDYRAAWRSKMEEVNATIAASAPQETLVDRPQVVKNVVRVSGPFTVEGVMPAEERLDASPIGGAPQELEAFGNDGQDAVSRSVQDDPANVSAYLERMISLLAKNGVRFLGNMTVPIERLNALSGSVTLHAEGEWNPQQSDQPRRLAVSFGPQYGPLTAKQVEDALWEASRRGFEDLLFAGFDIDGAAQATIEADPNPHIRCHVAHIAPDVLMGDLLKSSPSSQLFTVTGQPRIALHHTDEGYVVEMQGMDVYDPVNNAVLPTKATDVAAWFLDSDYDNKTFFVTHAFFPDKKAWEKLARALKSVVDADRFEAFSGTRSLPFQPGEYKRAAVKVIDPRGNEVMRVLSLDEEVRYGK